MYVLEKPAMAEQPQDVAFVTGKSGNLYAKAAGSPRFTYEWFHDGESIYKSTSNKLTLRKVKAQTHDGSYSVKITNPVGEVISDSFEVSILEPVGITAQPEKSIGIIQGKSGSMSVQANGTGLLAYQWIYYDTKTRKWSDVVDANSATHVIEDMEIEDVGKYRCIVSNGPSSYTSKDAVVSIVIPPSITVQPQGASLQEGAKLTLESAFSGTPAPILQWQKQSFDGSWEDLKRKNKAELAFSKLVATNAGIYRLKASNPADTVYSDEAEVIVFYKPVLSQNPVHSTANEDATASFSVLANALDSSGTDVTYAWHFNKKPLSDDDSVSGATSSTLTIDPVALSHRGSYHCVVSNSVGSVAGSSAKLNVIQKPSLTKQLEEKTYAEGKTATLSVSVRGGKPISYIWEKNGEVQEDWTKNKVTLRALSSDDAGTYKLTVTNPAGSISTTATLVVLASAIDNDDIPVPDSSGPVAMLRQALGVNAVSGQTFLPLIDFVNDGSGEEFISFSYTQSKLATGMTYIVEHSTDLNTWAPLDLSKASVNRLDRGSFTEITIYLPAIDAAGFFRVRIEE